ncbi:hypothetical protein H6F98_31130 [Microcoleus sp. FACHB-SPT15]|uniref:hypothetical protein n=1 Tax=Microcoleus sp. FACHB-SPT15 TaxID=2692830 RepID=UPI00177D3AD9|nr:hypothetical protein [Microcoleus sp. FACHB-SPT15]MBD1809869.1 hypothetical protein [Microcoleus sp. FACHB-SPT15]
MLRTFNNPNYFLTLMPSAFRRAIASTPRQTQNDRFLIKRSPKIYFFIMLNS